MPTTFAHEKQSNPRIQEFNQVLADLCADEGLMLIDAALMWTFPDLSLHPAVTSDGLHISYQYFGTWLQIIKDHALSSSPVKSDR